MASSPMIQLLKSQTSQRTSHVSCLTQISIFNDLISPGYEKVNTITNQTWKVQHNGTCMFQLMHKVKTIKVELKEWSKNNIGNPLAKLQKNYQKND